MTKLLFEDKSIDNECDGIDHKILNHQTLIRINKDGNSNLENTLKTLGEENLIRQIRSCGQLTYIPI